MTAFMTHGDMSRAIYMLTTITDPAQLDEDTP